MFDKVMVTLSSTRRYAALVDGERVEIEAVIDGHPVRLGSGRWNGRSVGDCPTHVRPDVIAALSAAIAARIAAGGGGSS